MGYRCQENEFLIFSVEGRFLFLQLFLGAVGILNGDVLQLGFQIAAEGGHIFLTELGALGLLLLGQFPLLCQTGQFVDTVEASLVGQLDNTYIVDEKGNKTPLNKKKNKNKFLS